METKYQRRVCGVCAGSGNMTCSHCDGSGWTRDDTDNIHEHNYVNNKVRCFFCNGTGLVRCTGCIGKGYILGN